MPTNIQEAALQLIAAIVAAATPFIAAYVVKILKGTLTSRQLELASTIADHAVKVAEEVGSNTGAQGETKLAIAARTFTSLADGVKNVKTLNQEQVYDLIHSALVNFRYLTEPLVPELQLEEELEQTPATQTPVTPGVTEAPVASPEPEADSGNGQT